MSEIRFQSPRLPQTCTTFQGIPSFAPTNNTSIGLLERPLDYRHNVLSGSPDQLFNSTGSYISNPQSAAPLVSLQSNAAAAITNPSGNSDDGAGLNPLQVSGQITGGVGLASDALPLVGRAGKGLRAVSQALPKGVTQAAGRIGTGAGILGNGLTIAQGVVNGKKAWEEGNTAGVVSSTTSSLSAAGQLYRDGGAAAIDGVLGSEAYTRFRSNRAAGSAFRQSAPNASRNVVSAASRQATAEAMKGTLAKPAGAAVTNAAKGAAKATGTLASGTGVVGRNAARVALREGGEAAAKAAGKAVATSALKTGAKAAGRFVPGVNVAIAALDTATAAATLADPKASTGKKVTSVITAAGSIVAATNIPVVSQIGGAVSAVSSFIGSFF